MRCSHCDSINIGKRTKFGTDVMLMLRIYKQEYCKDCGAILYEQNIL